VTGKWRHRARVLPKTTTSTLRIFCSTTECLRAPNGPFAFLLYTKPWPVVRILVYPARLPPLCVHMCYTIGANTHTDEHFERLDCSLLIIVEVFQPPVSKTSPGANLEVIPQVSTRFDGDDPTYSAIFSNLTRERQFGRSKAMLMVTSTTHSLSRTGRSISRTRTSSPTGTRSLLAIGTGAKETPLYLPIILVLPVPTRA
jgi:hypothetical protein